MNILQHHSGSEGWRIVWSRGMTGFAVAMLAAALSIAWPHPVHGQEPASAEWAVRSAKELRATLGYGPEALAALGIDSYAHQGIMQAALTHVQNADAELTQALEAAMSGRRRVLKSAAAPAGYASAMHRWDAERSALMEATALLHGTLEGHLTASQRLLHARIASNAGLEAPLNLVGNLSNEQYAVLLRAQKRRDRFLLSPRNWHRHGQRRWVEQRFLQTIEETLTPAQYQEWQGLRAVQEAVLPDVYDRELALARIAVGRVQVNPQNGAGEGTDQATGGAVEQPMKAVWELLERSFNPWPVLGIQGRGAGVFENGPRLPTGEKQPESSVRLPPDTVEMAMPGG